VEISLSGRFMLESRLEYPCHTVDISLGGMRLSAAVKPRIGEKIILYIDALADLKERLCARFQTDLR